MDAASELTGTNNGKSAGREGTNMDVKLPGGGTLGAGGGQAKAKDTQPAGVVVRTAHSTAVARSWLTVRMEKSASAGYCRALLRKNDDVATFLLFDKSFPHTNTH